MHECVWAKPKVAAEIELLELGVLAEVVGLNLYHFARAFKQSIG
jgi:hypothetical protein